VYCVSDKYSGGWSGDWIEHSFTLELRERGKYGFLPPTGFIVPVGEELWSGILVLVNHVIANDWQYDAGAATTSPGGARHNDTMSMSVSMWSLR